MLLPSCPPALLLPPLLLLRLCSRWRAPLTLRPAPTTSSTLPSPYLPPSLPPSLPPASTYSPSSDSPSSYPPSSYPPSTSSSAILPSLIPPLQQPRCCRHRSLHRLSLPSLPSSSSSPPPPPPPLPLSLATPMPAMPPTTAAINH